MFTPNKIFPTKDKAYTIYFLGTVQTNGRNRRLANALFK